MPWMKQPEALHTMQTLGQDMLQEAAKKFLFWQGHDLLQPVAAVPVSEGESLMVVHQDGFLGRGRVASCGRSDRGTEGRRRCNVTDVNTGFDFLGVTTRKHHGKLPMRPSRRNLLGFLKGIRLAIKAHPHTSGGRQWPTQFACQTLGQEAGRIITATWCRFALSPKSTVQSSALLPAGFGDIIRV